MSTLQQIIKKIDENRYDIDDWQIDCHSSYSKKWCKDWFAKQKPEYKLKRIKVEALTNGINISVDFLGAISAYYSREEPKDECLYFHTRLWANRVIEQNGGK